jgi:hypothetical protein
LAAKNCFISGVCSGDSVGLAIAAAVGLGCRLYRAVADAAGRCRRVSIGISLLRRHASAGACLAGELDVEA